MSGVTTFFRRLSQTIYGWWLKFDAFTKRDGNPMTDELPSYDNCMNCGTELQGMYCHKCGQEATPPISRMRDFAKEYIKNITPIESLVLPTLGNLMFHPGRLPKEYCSGRYVSYMHPLKLNLLILLILITIFSFAGTDSKVQNSISSIMSQELFVSEMTLSTIVEDSEYIEKLDVSPRDTVTLVASHIIVQKYKQIVDVVDVLYFTEEERPDTLLAVVPTLLIDDKLLVESSGTYSFSGNNNYMDKNFMTIKAISEAWILLTSVLFGHFPLLMLLTTPFFVMALRFILRRRGYSKGDFYIFSFYYLAYVEIVLMFLYMAGMVFDYSFASVKHIVIFLLLAYLTIALKHTYDITSWVKSASAAVFVNTIYFAFCILFIFVFSLIIIVVSLMQSMM